MVNDVPENNVFVFEPCVLLVLLMLFSDLQEVEKH
jgi:hypothetical protein